MIYRLHAPKTREADEERRSWPGHEARQIRRRRLIEAETLGRVGEHVRVHRVRDVGLPVGDRAFLRGESLEDAAQEGEHRQARVLQFLDLELFDIARFGEPERVEATTRADVTLREFRERVLEDTRAVGFRGADEEDLDGEHRPEGRVPRARRRERRDGARELVRDSRAVIRGAERTRGEPWDTGAVFRGPCAGDAEHRPAAVDDFAFGVLFVAKRNDRGLAAARVGAKLRVQIRRREGAKLLDLFHRQKQNLRVSTPRTCAHRTHNPIIRSARVARRVILSRRSSRPRSHAFPGLSRLSRRSSSFVRSFVHSFIRLFFVFHTIDQRAFDVIRALVRATLEDARYASRIHRRTFNALFFAGALALVRRAAISVLIFLDDNVRLDATRTPVNEEASMFVRCARMAYRVGLSEKDIFASARGGESNEDDLNMSLQRKRRRLTRAR